MPIDLPPRPSRRFVRTRRSNFPYIMIFILCSLIVIFGAKPRSIEEPSAGRQQGTTAP